MALALNIIKPGSFRVLDGQGLDTEFAESFGQAFAQQLPRDSKVVLCHDMRIYSQDLSDALIRGLTNGGIDVLDLGMGPSELISYTVNEESCQAGIMVTASHNPKNYHGLKIVVSEARPWQDPYLVSQLKNNMKNLSTESLTKGKSEQRSTLRSLVDHFVEVAQESPFAQVKFFCHGLHGCGGLLSKPIMERLGLEAVWHQEEPSRHFHDDGPNPDMDVIQVDMFNLMKGNGYDLGLAWDGDGDRCVFYDGEGERVESCYISGFLSEYFLEHQPKSNIIHNTKQCLNINDVIEHCGGRTVQALTGQDHMKQCMREHDAIYGAEQSSHHYFRDFYFCDSGVLPWIYLLRWLHGQNDSIAELVNERKCKFSILQEVNVKSEMEISELLKRLEHHFSSRASGVDHFDGLSLSFSHEGWQVNVRASHTEPVVRINCEGTISKNALLDRQQEVIDVIG